MKKIFGIVLFVSFIGFSSLANAQSKVKHVEQKVKKGAKAVGNKTAELASKGAAKITDKTYKGKAGPNGQTIYIDEHDRYYWIDKKGHRHFVTEAELRNKVKD